MPALSMVRPPQPSRIACLQMKSRPGLLRDGWMPAERDKSHTRLGRAGNLAGWALPGIASPATVTLEGGEKQKRPADEGRAQNLISPCGRVPPHYRFHAPSWAPCQAVVCPRPQHHQICPHERCELGQ